jgi:hypothetical protein
MNVFCVCEQLVAAMMAAALQMGEKSEGLMEGIRQEMVNVQPLDLRHFCTKDSRLPQNLRNRYYPRFSYF